MVAAPDLPAGPAGAHGSACLAGGSAPASTPPGRRRRGATFAQRRRSRPPGLAGIIETGDPRSNGQGPGLVGSPVAILIGVVLLGAAAAGGTLLYLRLTRER